MNKPHTCDTVREMVFNYRRGELSELDEALFEESLDECPECARYVERMLDMLTVSAEADAQDYLGEPLTPAFADDLFASITAGLEDEPADDEARDDDGEPVEVPSTSGAPPVRLELGMASPEPDPLEDEELAPSAPGWPRAVAAAAALVLVAAAAWFGRGALLERPADDAQPGLAAADAPEPEGAPVVDEDAALARAFADLERSPDRVEAVEVFASGRARWHLESRPPEHTLHLERGTVLVEFVPRGDQTLRVLSGGTEVDVTGTVFYVATPEQGDTSSERDQPARVGVITGEVKVRRRAAPEAPAREVTLREGQELTSDQSVQPIEEATRERSRELVDLQAHHAALERHARRRAEPRDDDAHDATPTPAPEVEPAPVEEREAAKPGASARPDSAAREQARLAQLSQRARRAIRDRDYAGAARHIEQLLEQLPPGHFERATWRLEIARLYTRNLGQRDKAIEHLREFVEHHPHDVAAPSARRKLCSLLGMRAHKEPACHTLPEEP